ncbi:unnamed protein product [Psylliodes chrysocephalus]|uniref:Uncharacterized protein n=1 Tax=Psylliodes chrysocephalus TaxID=3402493 RepID=A0A9P0CFA8_9CUCU|nr:unnamed protein product [Psylliodes chrysocephala]
MSLKTRSEVNCPIFGAPKEIRKVRLPTFHDVIQGFLFTRNYLEGISVNRNRLVVEAADIIAKKIESIWKKAGIPTTDLLQVIGCDGTNLNTGHKGGVITLLEHRVKRPLQWFICELHANELPLRHLVQHLDGNTSGPRDFQGSIGRALNECEKLSIAKCQVIGSTLPNISFDDLGTDQKYLFDIFQAIINGTCSESLSKRNPGMLNHSRWLTTANIILLLYVASENSSEELLILATFVMKVYAPMWFVIKEPRNTNKLTDPELAYYLENDGDDIGSARETDTYCIESEDSEKEILYERLSRKDKSTGLELKHDKMVGRSPRQHSSSYNAGLNPSLKEYFVPYPNYIPQPR